ncbi:carbohydrate ABC transporter permease [Leifsonia shinshuensis]|uniref:Sugar ABC transporter permease n=1 Tax=Leifsonia shinshuensis TaxID=150026 RepID=A0A7G6YAB2_9MICO|nr:sugar ABC transporter permease [Leifsonia shinshuensis]QNE35427.1 sugar ABC transporter permease [Leifsonia shinshuensis]
MTTSVTPTRRASSRGGRSPRPPRAAWRGAQNRNGALFALPFFLGFAFVFVIPIVYAVVQSLFTVQSSGGLGLGDSSTVFAGFSNYIRAFQDSGFWASMVRVGIFALIQIPISLGLSLTAALLLDAVTKERRSGIFRFFLLVPYMVPAIVAALIWVYLYSPRVGPFTAAGNLVGLDINFFSPQLLWVSIGNLIVWMVLGFNMLIIYSALRGIDRSILEAARVDGAGAFRIAWSIKIPNVRGTLVLTGLISIIGMLQIFNEPLLFRGASPQTVTKDFTPIMSIYFQAFTSNNYNYAAALSVILAAVIGLCSFAFFKLTNRKAKA